MGNPKNHALMVEERNCHADLYHRRLREENLNGVKNKKQITGSKRNWYPQLHGKWYVVSGMESGFGIVTKTVDKKWVWISKIAVPLKECAVMIAEVLVVCVLTRVFYLIFCKSLCEEIINQRINQVLPCRLIITCDVTSESHCGSLSVGDVAGNRWSKTSLRLALMKFCA